MEDWFITNYVDSNPVQDQFSDYRGGFFTYDQHQGVDIALKDFTAMDTGVAVVAARCGTVTAFHDQEFDRHTNENQELWNYVTITHPDGSRAIYGHLKQHSVDVELGTVVQAGTIIGAVGSSGNSTGPHLHFEVRDPLDAVVDIFAESYNFSYEYAESAELLDAGLSVANDPAVLHSNFFHQTPALIDLVYASEGSLAWLKVVGLRQGDLLEVRLLESTGVSTVGTMVADHDYKSSYWYWNLGAIPTGQYTLDFVINGVPQPQYRTDFRVQ